VTSSRPPKPSRDAGRAGDLGGTWPLFNEEAEPRFPVDPKLAVTPFRPRHGDLETLEQRDDLPETTSGAEAATQRLRDSLPPPAPEWARAAGAMIQWLEARLKKGTVDKVEEALISRTWAAFSLGGTNEPQILRAAHLVSRAHHAIRESHRAAGELQAAIRDCAGVLHAGLPSAIRERMPAERAVAVVRKIRTEADSWAAVVDGTSELLGWRDYARIHAAAAIQAAIERNR
jgi:hypothetical protein